MIAIKTKPQTNIYNSLKNSFKDGLEFRRESFAEYYAKKACNITPDIKAAADITEGICKGINPLKLITMRTSMSDVDWEQVNTMASETSYRNKLIHDSRFKLENTFYKGSANPDICLMAWYDALAEHVIAAAKCLAGVKAPVPTIQEELISLSKSLSKDISFSDAKTYLYNSLKKLYPKTYKTRLKLCEQNYNSRVQKTVDDIVKTMISGK